MPVNVGGYLRRRIHRIRREFKPLWKNYLYQSFLATIVVFIILLMLNLEHPPAAGTALGVAITGFSPSVMVAVLTSSLVLAPAHRFSKRFLRDLT